MFEFEEVDGVTRVKWQSKLKLGESGSGVLDADFKLDGPDRHCFRLCCSFSPEERATSSTKKGYRINFVLKQLKSKENEENRSKRLKISSDKYGAAVSTDCKRPSSIWVNFNGGKKLLLKPNDNFDEEQLHSEWSEQFIVQYKAETQSRGRRMLVDLGLVDDDVDEVLDELVVLDEPAITPADRARYQISRIATASNYVDTNRVHRSSIPFICVLWIKFENADERAEMNVIKQLKRMFVDQSNCDVQFCFNQDRKIGAHISILSARSPVFAAMFQHNMKESKTGEVSIEDITPDIFYDMLHYVYSGRTVKPLNEETAQLMCMAADKYNIVELKKHCVGFLLPHIKTTNVLELIVWAHLHSFEEIMDHAIRFAVKYARLIFKSDEWEDVTKNHPDVCLLITRSLFSYPLPTIKKSVHFKFA